MINIVDIVSCRNASLQSDPWMDFVARWDVQTRGQPLYVRASGLYGGEIELKISPNMGALVEAIVIDPPPSGGYGEYNSNECDVFYGTPVFDRSEWGSPSERGYIDLMGETIYRQSYLFFARNYDFSELVLVPAPPVSYIKCGPLQVGVSEKGEACSISGIVTECNSPLD